MASEESVIIITNRAQQSVFAMERRMTRRAIPMRRKKMVGVRLRQRGGRFPGMKRSRRRRRKQHGRGFSLPYELVEQFI